MKVLLASRRPIVRREVAVFLAGAGIQVREAASLDEAWSALEADREVDVLLADMDTGDEGLKVAQQVRSRWPAIGLVLTSTPMRHLSPHAIPGNACFVPAPMPADLLLAEVRLLASRFAEDQPLATGR